MSIVSHIRENLLCVSKFFLTSYFSFADLSPGITDVDNCAGGQIEKNAAELPPLACPQCGRTYKMKRNLKTHMKFECGGQRNFVCHVCPAKYTQNISLRRHLLQRHNIYLPPKFTVPKRIFARYTDYT